MAGYFGDDGRRAEQGHHMVDIARERERCRKDEGIRLSEK